MPSNLEPARAAASTPIALRSWYAMVPLAMCLCGAHFFSSPMYNQNTFFSRFFFAHTHSHNVGGATVVVVVRVVVVGGVRWRR